MRIIEVINVRWFNATAWYAIKLAELLGRKGHDVLIIVQPGTEPEREARQQGLSVLPLDLNTTHPLKLLGLYAKLKSVLEKFKPHVVNCHRGESFIHWGLLRRNLKNFTLIRTRGDQRLPKSNMINKWLHRQAADCVISTNSAMTRHFLEAFDLPADRIRQIIGGVDRETFRFQARAGQEIRREFSFADNEFVIGLLGRFDRVKGQYQALQALASLVHEPSLEHVRLFLIGFDSAIPQKEVERWIKEMGLEKYVRISGRRADVPACISALDLGLVASLWSEAIARAALEIMSCRRPLISSRVGVMPDLLSDNALFPPGDIRAMADLTAHICRHPQKAEDLVQEQNRIMADLDDESFIRKTLQAYTLGRGNPS